MTRECDLFQPPRSMDTKFLVKCGIHIEGAIARRDGSVVIELELGWTLAFHHVLFVPLLRETMLSFSIIGGSMLYN